MVTRVDPKTLGELLNPKPSRLPGLRVENNEEFIWSELSNRCLSTGSFKKNFPRN